MGRFDILRSYFDPAGIGLEIGANSRGIAPKREGFNVRIIDYTDAETLRGIVRDVPGIDETTIEDVDYVSDGRPIGQVIPERKFFDYVIGSHLIEHVPDFVGFLKDCESVLKDSGVLVLAVPDKRLTFDVFRPLTSIGEVMQRHVDGGQRHPPGKILDYYAYASARDGQFIVWNPDSNGPLNFVHPMSEAKKQFEIARSTEAYIDTHPWVFTPSSFRLLVNDLFEMGEIALREVAFHQSPHPETFSEFYFVLSGSGRGAGLTRSELMRAVLQETSEIKF